MTLRILLVEDNPGDARLIRETLHDVHGHGRWHIDQADSLASALARLDLPGVDVVLLDLSLPDSQGLDTCQRVLARARWAPIVVLSGTDDEQIAVAAVQGGAQDYLIKGQVDGSLLVRALRYAIERKRAEQERVLLLEHERLLRAEAEHLAAERRAILHRITDGVVIAGADGEITYANPAALELHGIPALPWPRVGSAVPYVLLTADGHPYAHEDIPLIRAALHGETVRNVEMRIRRADGSEVAVQGNTAPVDAEDGHRLGAVLTLHDVTAQRQLERHKDEFFANISHDLRTPVAAIKASIGVVLANEPPNTAAPLQRLLRNIDVATDHLAALVDDLLELTSLQVGRTKLRLERSDLKQLAIRCVRTIEPLVQSRKQRVELSVPPRPVWASVDTARLERALLNLLSNAQQHGYESGVIRLNLVERDGGVVFAVGDNGPGIPPSEQALIFERFYRQNVDIPLPNRGSGLGLPIARGMVELHGGRVWVESVPGAGSTFFVALPDSTKKLAGETDSRTCVDDNERIGS